MCGVWYVRVVFECTVCSLCVCEYVVCVCVVFVQVCGVYLWYV